MRRIKMDSWDGSPLRRHTGRVTASLPLHKHRINSESSDSKNRLDDDEWIKKRAKKPPLKLWWMRWLVEKPMHVKKRKERAKDVRPDRQMTLLTIVLLGIFLLTHRHGDEVLDLGSKHRALTTSTGRRTNDQPLLPLLLMRPGTETNSSPFVAALLPIEIGDQSHDYASLSFDTLHSGQQRQIEHTYSEGETYREVEKNKKKSKHVHQYYAYDDDYVRGKSEITEHHTCTRPSWYRLYHPVCNQFHEIDQWIDPGYYISSGYYRSVWGYQRGEERIVMKLIRFHTHDFKRDIYEYTRMDALSMERLSSSPRIVDIYGHCATSVMTEQMVKEIERHVVPGRGYAKQADLDDKADVNPRNNFTPTEKLTMALEMAEAIADVHGHKDGVIVHDDIQLCQFLRNKDGIMKLNDFNRAEPMLWDVKNQEYCRYRNGQVWGNYRAPEEDADEPLNEEIDVYSFGNNIYGLLTGLWVYYTNEDDAVVQKFVKNGELPYIDERYRTRSYAEGALVKAMERSWAHNPDDRADIFEIVDFLRAAVSENSRLLAAQSGEH